MAQPHTAALIPPDQRNILQSRHTTSNGRRTTNREHERQATADETTTNGERRTEPPGARRTPTATASAKGPTVTATTSNVRRKTHEHYERERRTTDPKPQPQATTDDNEPLGASIGGLRRRDVDCGVHGVPPASRSPTVVARRRGVRTPRGRHDKHNDGAIAKIAPGARRIETAPTNPRTDPHHTTSRTPPPLHRHHSPQPTPLTRGLTHAPHGEATAAHARPTTEQRETPNEATGDTTNNTTSGGWRRTDSKRREGVTSDEDDKWGSGTPRSIDRGVEAITPNPHSPTTAQRRAHRNRHRENDKDAAQPLDHKHTSDHQHPTTRSRAHPHPAPTPQLARSRTRQRTPTPATRRLLGECATVPTPETNTPPGAHDVQAPPSPAHAARRDAAAHLARRVHG
ncbi:hypothetical protein BD410DRAFT_831009 [Rickenella mellea]|uniref:Uncharacterized protein n=1 Tax=Rickenella mellea TaxID=50990 RepID=A0A4Y7PS66_9AGAM|nr:hypothetical protein BD410DRAFT_831009 [Rickenella mellea]